MRQEKSDCEFLLDSNSFLKDKNKSYKSMNCMLIVRSDYDHHRLEGKADERYLGLFEQQTSQAGL